MKAISLWQPWASAMASGVKQNETRSWFPHHRGDLVICSSKRKPSLEEVGDLAIYETALAMPYGCALCVVELYEAIPSDLFSGPKALELSPAERDLGDYTPGRWIWLTRNCRELKHPVPVIGHQGFWNLDAQTEAAIRAQL